MLNFELFSDGASFNNGYKNKELPQFSACGVVITCNGRILKKGSRLFENETISYAELKGAILVIELLKKRIIKKFPEIEKPYNIKVYSDSQFVVKSINEWMYNWIKKCNDWKTDVWYNSSGNEVAYYELFKRIKLDYIDNSDYDIEFIHVKGHNKSKEFKYEMNNLCDKLATDEIKKKKKELKLK